MASAWSTSTAIRQLQTNGRREAAIGRHRLPTEAADPRRAARRARPQPERHSTPRHAGRLHRIHRGVYAIHPPPYSQQQLWLAATLACGPGSALSDWCAAAHLALTETPPLTSHVTNPTGAGRGLAGITVHRRGSAPATRSGSAASVTTTAARTIIDCAHSAGLEGTEELIMAADSKAILRHARLEALAEETSRPSRHSPRARPDHRRPARASQRQRAARCSRSAASSGSSGR